MQATLIPISSLILAFIPIVFIFFIFIKWDMDWKKLLLASGRMITQLMIIGYFLTFIFNQKNPAITIPLVLVMMSISAWISLHSVGTNRKALYKYAFSAMLMGAIPNLLLTTIILIPHTPWFDPAFLIPLAGMVFTQAMNCVGISSERYLREIEKHPPQVAAKEALQACLIPIMNSYMAVGLVSIPGMMTGQILAGVDPLIAARYQVLIMTMMMGAGAVSAFFFLYFVSKSKVKVAF